MLVCDCERDPGRRFVAGSPGGTKWLVSEEGFRALATRDHEVPLKRQPRNNTTASHRRYFWPPLRSRFRSVAVCDVFVVHLSRVKPGPWRPVGQKWRVL